MPRVLTIEDDAVTGQEIVAELTSHGLEVEWADNGREGLAKAIVVAATPNPTTAVTASRHHHDPRTVVPKKPAAKALNAALPRPTYSGKRR